MYFASSNDYRKGKEFFQKNFRSYISQQKNQVRENCLTVEKNFGGCLKKKLVISGKRSSLSLP